MPDGDIAVDFPVVAATVDGGIDGRRAYPSADLRGGIQAAGNVLRGGGQKGLQCAQVGKEAVILPPSGVFAILPPKALPMPKSALIRPKRAPPSSRIPMRSF